MFQNFDTEANLSHARERLKALRALMAEYGYDAFLVPHADEYQGEYLPPCSMRLEWLTGFSGSAGFAIILKNEAILFTDGRYRLQIRQQTDASLFSYEDYIAIPPAVWLHKYLTSAPAGKKLKIAFDPRLHSIKEIETFREAVRSHGELAAAEGNLIDAIWHNRPALPRGAVSLQPLSLTGRTAEDKLAEIRAKTAAANARACLLTDPASIAWAFNIRGCDIAHTPVALGFALLPVHDKAIIFMDAEKFSPEVKNALAPVAEIAAPQSIAGHIAAICRNGGGLMADNRSCPEIFRLMAKQAGGQIVNAENPVLLPRAIKTEAELAGARAAHKRDGAAMARFLSWLDRQIAAHGAAEMDEIKAAEALENFRCETAANQGSRLEDISFDTISGAGADGAIIHYRVTRATNRQFRDGELYLVDSGAQYRDGTTDITRTVAIGDAGEQEKRCFTLALKSMINLSLARFPQGARGRDLDILARNALWQNGLDYAHGTGHGVGSFLSVHEGPQTISRAGAQVLFPGMIVSNEPGYYREGAFGIRIENLLIVREPEMTKGGDIPMLSFETLTLCPIDRRLILPEMLSEAERDWLNAYHARVYETISPMLEQADKDWLAIATEPI